MKRYIILTSVLALAACGGGSGGGGAGGVYSAPTVKEIRSAFDMGANPSVNSANTNLTGMASYSVTSPANEDDLMAYVANQLGDDVYSAENYNSLLNRSATKARASTPLGTSTADVEKRKAIAAAKVANMKQVLFDMVNADDPEAYVNANRESVREALVLFDKLDKDDNISEMSDAALFALFEDGGDAITKDNVMSKFAEFDHDNFGFSKETIDNVVFYGTGDGSKFKFNVDLDGKITDMALFEDPMADYGNYDDNKKFVYTPAEYDGEELVTPSSLVRIARTDADEEYIVSHEGWFKRNGNTKDFNGTYYLYTIDLGEHNITGAPSVGKLRMLDVFSTNPNLSGEELKQAMYQAILARGNKDYSTQSSADDKSKFASVVKYYADLVANYDEGALNDLAATVKQKIDGTATIEGVGKDVGLKYADFGFATLKQKIGTLTSETYSPYAGAYESRVINDLPEGTHKFKGKVVAAIEHSQTKADVKQAKHDMLMNGNGELTFSGGNQTLAVTGLKDALNNDWYDVTVEQVGTNNPTFKFSAENKDNIPTEYQFFTGALSGANMVITANSDVADASQHIVKVDGETANTLSTTVDGYRIDGGLETKYIGPDTATVTEAVGRFAYSEEWHDDGNHNSNEVAIYGAFGGTK